MPNLRAAEFQSQDPAIFLRTGANATREARGERNCIHHPGLGFKGLESAGKIRSKSWILRPLPADRTAPLDLPTEFGGKFLEHPRFARGQVFSFLRIAAQVE